MTHLQTYKKITRSRGINFNAYRKNAARSGPIQNYNVGLNYVRINCDMDIDN